MQTYRMWITFNDGLRPYHNEYTVFTSDQEAVNWIVNYAASYKYFKWFEFIDFLLVNLKTGREIKGKITN